MADDLGYETVGAYGGESYSTPNIDRLADEGLRFDHAYSQPLCTPTRVQIMTGRYNVRNYDIFEKLPKGQTTFGNVLCDAGYKTFIGGKWQLSENIAGSFDDPIHFGFDEYFLWQLDRRPRRYYGPGFEVNIPAKGWNKERVDYSASAGHFGPDLVVDQINAFIERNQAEPFFIYYPMMLSHDPFLPTPDHPDYNPTATFEPNNPVYFQAMAEYTDKMVGRILDQLDALELSDDTLVIFCGDNGTKDNVTSILNGQTIRGGKSETTNAGTHVPFVARWPGIITAGQSTDVLIDFTDVLPTLAAAAGVDAPTALDGYSLLPELQSRAGSLRQWSYCWYKPRNDNENEVAEFARTQRYRLYRSGQFFDLQEDVLEQSPLDTNALSPEQQAVYDSLISVLAGFDTVVADRQQAPRLPLELWTSAPQAGAEAGSVVMTAALPEDANGPVEYQFENLTTGGVSSWSFDAIYKESGLVLNGPVSYHYRSRDLLGNVSAWSSVDSNTEITPDPNPPLTAVEQGNANGEAGAFNLGQSFTIPTVNDSHILEGVRFNYAMNKGGGTAWYLTIYDGFTDHQSRGSLLAVSTNEVTAPSTDGAAMLWSFDNLILSGNATYYAVVSDASGQPLSFGQGVPAKRSDSDPYSGGQRLKEGGTDDMDLMFSVVCRAHPRTFSQWLLRESLPDDTGLSDLDQRFGYSFALRYFFDLDQSYHTAPSVPYIDGEGIVRFSFRPGIDDIAWELLYCEDLQVPRSSWQRLSTDAASLQVDHAAAEVWADLSGFDHLFVSVELTHSPE